MQSDKDLYRQLRTRTPEQLWTEDVPRFNRAPPPDRRAGVAVVRAVGVAFAAPATPPARRDAVRRWLTGLLQDPDEKVRRYAMAALPKLGGGGLEAEARVLALLKRGDGRERRHAGRALNRLGTPETLAVLASIPGALDEADLKVKSSVARAAHPGRVRLDRELRGFGRLRIHLHCRRGLEGFVREEVEEAAARGAPFRVAGSRPGCVAMHPTGAFALADLYRFRCFATVGFVLGSTPAGTGEDVEPLAALVASPLAQDLLGALTEGPWRYRLEVLSARPHRATVLRLAARAHALCPGLLNDPRLAPWSVDLFPSPLGTRVELRPRLTPDPRLGYRVDDVPAASHPPLAACMARLAGIVQGDVVWDPFCGSGLELIERALRGGVRRILGTDTSAAAIAVARANLAAAGLGGIPTALTCCDFREHARLPGLGPGGVTLVVTNPPMGRRIRVPDLHALIGDLFAAAAKALAPGGRLVFANPLRVAPPDGTLRLEFRQVIDLGGFDCRLERYRRTP